MRIISQRKDLSIDFDRTPICVSYNHVCAIMDGQQKVIGNYKTEERAQEVFEDIHKAYSGDYGEPVKITELDESAYKTLLNSIVDPMPIKIDSSVEYSNNGIYIMPEE